MPVSGHRSKGCYRCRSKKVRCDEKIPACQRCTLSGVQCPGYRPENELVFHSMNQIVENKVLGVPKNKGRGRRVISQRQRSNDSAEEKSKEGKLINLQKVPFRYNQSRTMPRSMATDWNDSASCLLFQDYVLQTPDIAESPGFLHGLPDLCLDNPNGVISNAVKAVALANLGNQLQADSLIAQSRIFYGKALLQVRKALAEGTKTFSNDLVGGILIVNMYDMFTGDIVAVWNTHADALALLLRARGTASQFKNEKWSGLARGAHRVVLFKNLLKRKQPGLESELFDASIEGDTSPSAQVGRGCNRIARILPVADAVLAEDPSIPGSCQRLLKAISLAQNEDKNFEMWRYSDIVSNPHRSVSGISALQDLEVAGFWNPYRAARLILLETFVRLLVRVREYPELLIWAHHMDRVHMKACDDINITVGEITDTVSEILGDIDVEDRISRLSLHGSAIAGYTSIWPLRVSLMVKTLSIEQRKHIYRQLEYLYKALGLKQARTIKGSN